MTSMALTTTTNTTSTNTSDNTSNKTSTCSRKRTVREMASRMIPVTQDSLLEKMLQDEKLLVRALPEENQMTKRNQAITPMPCWSHPHQAWREQTAKWFYDVIDHLKHSREIVHVAMNMLERYLDTIEITSKSGYQLAAISSLYLAVRLSHTSTPSQKKLKISEILVISGVSTWTVADIQTTSTRILQSLKLLAYVPLLDGGQEKLTRRWNSHLHQALVHATPQAFAKVLLSGLPSTNPTSTTTTTTTTTKSSSWDVPVETKRSWMEMSLYLLELSVCDGGCRHLLPSHVALASILVASKKTTTCTDCNSNDDRITSILMEATGNEMLDVSFICERLEYIYRQSQDSAASASSSCPTLIVDYDQEEQEQGQGQEQDYTVSSTPPQHYRPISPCPILDIGNNNNGNKKRAKYH
jgi:hypothetical protein